ncbi:winged helix-turn-helix domain-containing protein [Paraburkholderia sp. BR14263]|uniref:ATP-binding protein n=1 Tax=unclassified Paraburkholderia TaxID=2615204 RepID=UPI0034CEFC01
MYVFGRVSVSLGGRQVYLDGQPLALGARAFDILELLIRAEGAIVTKDEILRLVWPTTFVVENNIQVHISALRKLLGEGWIRTVLGRGYRLVRPSSQPSSASSTVEGAAVLKQDSDNRQRAWALAGREDQARRLYERLQHESLITVTGPGGVGKTRLALTVAKAWAEDNRAAFCHVDFADHIDRCSCYAERLPMLLQELRDGSAGIAEIASEIGDRRIVLVLDNCEREVGSVAALCECILAANRNAVLLATSREPLRAKGEYLHTVPPLSLPHEGADEAAILASGAVTMFFDRARATGTEFPQNPQTLAAIADVCRRLSGLPLALELAVARAALLGAQALAHELQGSALGLAGRSRTAHPRQRTLRASIEWSYLQLGAAERTVLHRLAAFEAPFDLASACKVAAVDGIQRDTALECVHGLAAKSLLTLHSEGANRLYSLFPIVRAYAAERLAESGKRVPLAPQSPLSSALAPDCANIRSLRDSNSKLYSH